MSVETTAGSGEGRRRGPFEHVLTKLAQREVTRCEKCGYYQGNHSHTCENQTPEQWRLSAISLANTIAINQSIDRARANNAREDARRWQDKYHTLRLENNALRRKLARNPKPQQPPAQPEPAAVQETPEVVTLKEILDDRTGKYDQRKDEDPPFERCECRCGCGRVTLSGYLCQPCASGQCPP